jgi:hypothetical protein
MQGYGHAEHRQQLHQLLEVHQAGVPFDLGNPGLADTKKRPQLRLCQATSLSQCPQVLAKLVREAERGGIFHVGSL